MPQCAAYVPTLRERKKIRTREAIGAAALRLFAERGYAAVTIGDVAAAAEVGERTVFRYFGDKEDLLFGEDEAFRAALASALAGRPEGEAPVEMVAGASAAVAAALAGRREEVAARLAVIRATPALQARERAKHAGFESVVADGLAARGVARPAARLLARVGVGCYDEAVERWLADEDADAPGLAGHLRRALTELRDLLAEAEAAPASGRDLA